MFLKVTRLYPVLSDACCYIANGDGDRNKWHVDILHVSAFFTDKYVKYILWRIFKEQH